MRCGAVRCAVRAANIGVVTRVWFLLLLSVLVVLAEVEVVLVVWCICS